MTKTCVVASDLGSSACKTMIVGLDGQVLAAAQQETPTSTPKPGWVEQDPHDWYRAFCATVRGAMEQATVEPSQVAGVGIVGVTHNAVLLDESDQPLRPSILLFDTRSSAQVEQIQNRWGNRIRERTLNDVSTLWTWPQLLWVRQHAPEVWRATRRILFEKDYVRNRLAPAPVTDVIDASGSLLFDPVENRWIEEFCEDLGLPREWLPTTVNATEVVAKVGTQGAADTGLAVGTPVIAGTSDTAAEVLGAGALRPGSGIIKLASVGRIAVVSEKPVRRPHILNYRHVLDGLWYPGTASKFAAASYRWLRDVLWGNEAQPNAYERMDEEAAQAPPGCDGLIFHPHLNGEWAPHWDDRMRGDFLGLTTRHRRTHLTRSVLEGVAFGLKDALSELEDPELQAQDLRLIGNGSRSMLWGAIAADVLDRPLSIPEQSDAVYGAALVVAMGIGAIPRTAESLESIIRVRQAIEPNGATVGRYEKLFQIYRDADQALRQIAGRLHQFERE